MKINDSVFVQLLEHKYNALKDLWSFIKRFVKYVWTCFLAALTSAFVILLIYRIAKWVFGSVQPLYFTIGLIIGTVTYGYILRDTF